MSNRTATNQRARDRNQRSRDQPRDGHINPEPAASHEPPHNDADERIVLGTMMLSADTIPAILDILTAADDFYRPQHVQLYSAITAAYYAGVPTEPNALLRFLHERGELQAIGGGDYLHTCIRSVPTTANATWYAHRIADDAHHRRGEVAAMQLLGAYRTRDPERIREALTRLTQTSTNRHTGLTDLLIKGGTFVLDVPNTIPAVWGSDDEVLWAEGESLVIAGPSGVGKTTITGQLVRARLGLLDKVLGWPVQPGKRILYLAMDRPDQIRRAMHRLFTEDERAILDEYCVFWKGPPPHDIAKRPETLLELTRAADADTLIVDSVKDAAIGLSDDEVGASYNRARQGVLADGVQMLELHHMRKAGSNGAAPNTLSDVFGSAHLVNGAGSVVVLWGNAGDPIVDFKHLKQPRTDVGPFKVLHEGDSGLSSIWDGADLLELLRRCATTGVSAHDAACVINSTEKPSNPEVEKARRRLEKMAAQGLAVMSGGGRGRGNSARWYPAAPKSWVPDEFQDGA